MQYRFEFDPVNKILLARCEGRLTDDTAAQLYRAIRAHSTAIDVSAGIWDMSTVTEFALSADFLRDLASQAPAMGHANSRPRILVASTTVGYGLARMFQILGEPARPLLKVVHTLDEALAALGVQSPHFEPLD